MTSSGMISLDGKLVYIAGGAGEVGEGITRQFLKSGATIVVSSRSQEKLDALRARLEADEKLITIVGDVGSPEGAESLRNDIEQQVGQLTGVVASLGGWWQGQPLTEISLEIWHQLIDNSLTAHFITARTFLPVIAGQSDSSYTMINGAAGLHPVPTAGPVSISAAGQMMMQKILSVENKESPVRINSLVLATPILTRSRSEGQPGWLSADDAGKYAAYLASDAAAEVDGETVVFESRDQLDGLGG